MIEIRSIFELGDKSLVLLLFVAIDAHCSTALLRFDTARVLQICSFTGQEQVTHEVMKRTSFHFMFI